VRDNPFVLHAPLVEEILRIVCYRHGLRGADSEDFASAARLRLLEDDCAILRKFEGRSALKTYLTAVIVHLFQDWRNARWGKWRPSAEAKRAGPLGIRLEQLVVRDGLTLDEAHETLTTNYAMVTSREKIARLAARFPARTGRHMVTDEWLADWPAADAGPEQRLLDRADAQRRTDLSAALAQATRSLAPEDQLILKMRFADGIGVADIARTLRRDQKQLYRRIDRLLADLRRALATAGFTGPEVIAFLRAFTAGFSEAGAETGGLGRPLSEDGRVRPDPPGVS
jgi:RNA polymerase sigma factor (sigma-70 family)